MREIKKVIRQFGESNGTDLLLFYKDYINLCIDISQLEDGGQKYIKQLLDRVIYTRGKQFALNFGEFIHKVNQTKLLSDLEQEYQKGNVQRRSFPFSSKLLSNKFYQEFLIVTNEILYIKTQRLYDESNLSLQNKFVDFSAMYSYIKASMELRNSDIKYEEFKECILSQIMYDIKSVNAPKVTNNYFSLLGSNAEKMCIEILSIVNENIADTTNELYDILYLECFSLLFSYIDIILSTEQPSMRANIIQNLLRQIEGNYSNTNISIMQDIISGDNFIKSRYASFSSVAMKQLENYGQFAYQYLSNDNMNKLKNTVYGRFCLIFGDFIYYYYHTKEVPNLEALQPLLILDIFESFNTKWLPKMIFDIVPVYLKEIEINI